MQPYYYPFYQDLYIKSGGYIPSSPCLSKVEIGDLIIMRSGELIKIGNVLDTYFKIDEDIVIGDDWSPGNLPSWNIQSGVRCSFKSGNGADDSCPSSLMLEFDQKGDYIFNASKIRTKHIENFHQLKFQLLQALTAEKFSFKEIFVVTSVATTELFSMIIADDSKGKIVMTSKDENSPILNFSDLANKDADFNILDQQSIGVCDLRKKEETPFFKAQKIVPSDSGKELVKKYLEKNLPKSMQENAERILRFCPTQILPAAEIFPTSVHDLYEFRAMNLVDIAVLFGK